MENLELFGIENIKKALKFAGNLTKAITHALEDDGKIKGVEYYQIIATLPGLFPIVKNIGEILNEFDDLTDEERLEVSTYFASEFDIPNDQIEDKIERAFTLIIAIADLVDDSIKEDPEVE